PLAELGYQPPLWVDENMRIVRPPVAGDLTQRTTLPPGYQVAAHEPLHQDRCGMEAGYRQGELRGASGAIAARGGAMEGQYVETGDDARHTTRQRILVAGALPEASGPPQLCGSVSIHRRRMAGAWREDDDTKPAKGRGRTRDRRRIRGRRRVRALHNATILVRRRAGVELRELHSSPGVGVQLIHFL